MKAYRYLLAHAALMAAFCAPLTAAGNPPELMSYQGYLVDANGVPLGSDGVGNSQPANYDVVFRIFTAPSGGTLLWAEQQTITVDKGYFSILLGEGTANDSDPTGPISAVFLGISAPERYIGMSVRFEVGGEFTDILPRLQLMSSPYAFLSSQARSVVNPDGQRLITAEGGAVTVAGTLTTTQAFTAPTITGSGAGLTNLNANNLTSGTVNDARLSANMVRRNVSNTFSAGQSFQGNNTFSGTNTFTNTLALNDNQLRLRTLSDGNHGLGWFGAGRTFSGFAPDGPVLWGNSGGALGTSNGARALSWDNAGNATMNQISFGSVRRQHLNLWSTTLGIGVQENTLYFRSSNTFAWHVGGSHSNNYADAGTGGTRTMVLDGAGNLGIQGWFSSRGITTVYTGSSLGWSETRYTQDGGNYGYFAYYAGNGAFSGGGRRFIVGATGLSTQMSDGSNRISYAGGNNWGVFSDERIKKDIIDAEPMLERALDVRLRRYRYRDQADDDHKLHLGVIAQELLPLFPGMVSEGSFPEADDSRYIVGYTDFGMISLQALQEMHEEQSAINAELRAENAELRSLLEQLQASVAALLEAQASGQ